MTDRRRVLTFAGVGLIGAGVVMAMQSGHHAATPGGTKPPPGGTPPPTTKPPAGTPPPATQRIQIVGHFPNWDGSLWGIAQHYYGNGALYPRIYGANAATIEATARAHGFATSEAGHWIFPGERLVIP